MMEDLLAWLQHSEGPLAYLVLGGSSAIEYVVPPFPGDTIALFGTFLAATAGFHVLFVYLALNAGALVGGMTVYGIGRWIGEDQARRMPWFLRGRRSRAAIEATIRGFERHGALYLSINRFVPALRSFFFLAAGIAGLRAWKVALFGTLSAMAWNAILLGLGWEAGANFERLRAWVETYTYAAAGIAVAVLLIAGWRRLRRERVDPAEGPR